MGRPPDRPSSGSVPLALAAGMLLGALLVVWATSARTPTQPTAAGGPTTVRTGEALLGPADLDRVGLTTGVPVAREEPPFPLLCGAATWTDVWSSPTRSVVHDHPTVGPPVTEHVADYADAATAAVAFDRLVRQATDCPALPGGGSVEVTDRDAGLGDESVVLLVGDGPAALTWSVVVRSGDHLVQVDHTVAGEPATTRAGDGAEATTRALAGVALDRLGPGTLPD